MTPAALATPPPNTARVLRSDCKSDTAKGIALTYDFPHIGFFVPLCIIPPTFNGGMTEMPVTMNPTTRLVLSWDMFEEVATIEPENGQSMDADTKCKFDVGWNGSDVTVTVSPDSLRVRIGASETAELLKHEQGHSDITFLTGLATGRAILNNSSGGQTTITTHQTRGQRMQERYDRQTQHGRNATQQQRWNQILDAAIQHAQTVLDGQAL